MGNPVFTIKTEHMKLLKRMYWSWYDCEFGAPSVDCKRPYCFWCALRQTWVLPTFADFLFACIAGGLLSTILIAGVVIQGTCGLPIWLYILVASLVSFGGTPLAYRLTAGRQRLLDDKQEAK